MNDYFKVGGRYENVKGPYQVCSIYGDMMVIRWDTGEEIATDVKGQLRVIKNTERMLRENAAGKNRRVPSAYGELFKGLQECDFNVDVTGTHWRSREQLGGAVTRHIAAPFPVNSWAIYHRPEVHWADWNHYPEDDAWVKAKFAAVINENRMWAGFYVERSHKSEDSRKDWNGFLNWLVKGGEKLLADMVMNQDLCIEDELGEDRGCFGGQIRFAEGKWQLCHDKNTQDTLPNLHAYLSTLRDDRWLNLLIKRDFPRAEAIARGPAIACDLGKIFTALLPVYEGSVGQSDKIEPGADQSSHK